MSSGDDTRAVAAPEYLELPLGEFLESLAAGSPAPGGGGASAVATALAAALAGMSARLSGERLSDAPEFARRADSLRERAARLVDEDAGVYGRVISALRLPDDEPGRRDEVDRALREAADTPLAAAGFAREAAEIAARLAAEGNPNLRGDALTAAYLAEAAARSAAELVRLNVEGIRHAGAEDERREARARELARETAALARRASGRGW